MNPAKIWDDTWGPLDIISAGIGTVRQLAHGELLTEQIAVSRYSGFNTAACRAMLGADGIDLYEDTMDATWFYFRVPNGAGRAAIAILQDYGADAVLRGDT